MPRRTRTGTLGALLLLGVTLASDLSAQELWVGALGLEFGEHHGFVALEGRVQTSRIPGDVRLGTVPVGIHLQGSLGARSRGLREGYCYRNGRVAVVRCDDPTETLIHPDTAREGWSLVGVAGGFLLLGDRFGPGVIYEWVQAPPDDEGGRDEPGERAAGIDAAIMFVQPLGEALELSLLWHGEGGGRYRATVLWKVPAF